MEIRREGTKVTTVTRHRQPTILIMTHTGRTTHPLPEPTEEEPMEEAITHRLRAMATTAHHLQAMAHPLPATAILLHTIPHLTTLPHQQAGRDVAWKLTLRSSWVWHKAAPLHPHKSNTKTDAIKTFPWPSTDDEHSPQKRNKLWA